MSKIEIEKPYPRLMVRDFYSPREVVQFRQEHIFWLLKHIQDLRRDYYPLGIESGSSIAGLLYIRLTQCLKQCGLDGLILLAWQGLDMFVEELGQYLNLSGSEVTERAQIALRYVSYKLQHQGEDPISYQEFKHLVELADKQTKNRE